MAKPKSSDRAVHCADHEAKASHRAKLSIKGAGTYIPHRKLGVGEEVNTVLPQK